MSAPPAARPPATYLLGRWAFLRLLGVVYLVAFVSLWVQIDGLVGSDGILPVGEFLERVRAGTGPERYWLVPTLLWLGHGDAALHALCAAGVLLALALAAGVATRPVLLLAWAVYLSLACAGQTFLHFQWDILLLEAGFAALFVAPGTWRPRGPHALPPPRRAGLWVVWLLLFKLMFLSGVVKPLSLDETWWRLTALDYHYWTQPLPTWTSWYADRLPAWLDRLSLVVLYGCEIAAPLLVFAGRAGRRALAGATLFLMLAIASTGNYGFFNLLTATLALPLLDDALLGRLLPARWVATVVAARREPGVARAAGAAHAALAVALLFVSALTFVEEIVRTVPRERVGAPSRALLAGAERWILSWGRPWVLHWTGPLRTVSGYGLFRAMTTERPEIVIEGSADGRTWKEYAFRWKPGDPTCRPRFAAPHMPRLDWQMWFAALSPRRAEPWMVGLMRRLLEGAPDVLALLAENPFPDAPPRFVRLLYYHYEFATPEARHQDGAWWQRTPRGALTVPLSLDGGLLRGADAAPRARPGAGG
jgi:hypothetical protein